jgi:RNA polymerase sigma factor (TIGR02999 family)
VTDLSVSQDDCAEASIHAANLQRSLVRTPIENSERVFPSGHSFVIRSKGERDIGNHALGATLLRPGGVRGRENDDRKGDADDSFHGQTSIFSLALLPYIYSRGRLDRFPSLVRNICCKLSARTAHMQAPEGITQLLIDWEKGDQAALEKLMPLVYSELRRLASNYLRRERAEHTLQPTALVNEAYLKLVDQRNAKWQNRAHFFGISAQLMRRILVDHARQHQAVKRGGSQQQRISITSVEKFAQEPEVDLLALNEALDELAHMDAQQSRIVELKFFGGLSIEEIGEVLGIGHATVERDWKMARAWLRRQLQ